MNKPSEKALEEIKSKVSAASWDHADDMQKSVLANEIWWIAHNALEAAALARAEDGEGPVPWGWANKHGAVTRFLPEKWREIGHELTPLYTHPAPQPSGPVEALPEEVYEKAWIAFRDSDKPAPYNQVKDAVNAALSALTSSKPDAPQAVPSGWEIFCAEAEVAWAALEKIVRRADPSRLSPVQYEAAAFAAKIAEEALNVRGEIRAVGFPTEMFPAAPTAGGEDA